MDTNQFTSFINNLNLLCKHLERKIISTIPFTFKINVKVVEKQEILSDQCIAVVQTLSGSCYQCTRKKKFTNFCGLHHERKSSFKTIYDQQLHKSVNTTVSISCDIRAPVVSSSVSVQENSTPVNMLTNTNHTNISELQTGNDQLKQNEKHMDDQEMYSIYYNCNTYYIHTKTSNVYYEDCGDFVYIGLLNSLPFSIRIY
jgi:hypothetical protein